MTPQGSTMGTITTFTNREYLLLGTWPSLIFILSCRGSAFGSWLMIQPIPCQCLPSIWEILGPSLVPCGGAMRCLALALLLACCHAQVESPGKPFQKTLRTRVCQEDCEV